MQQNWFLIVVKSFLFGAIRIILKINPVNIISFLNVVYFQKKLFFLHIWTIFNDPRNSLTLALLLWTILITFRVLSYNNPMTYYNKYLLRLIKFRKRCDRVAIVWILVTAKLIDFHWHLFPRPFQNWFGCLQKRTDSSELLNSSHTQMINRLITICV